MKPTVDSHVHIWEQPWENFVVGTRRDGRFAQRDLLLSLMDRHGVERACVLAACNQQNPRNNEFIAELCEAQPDRFIMFSAISLDKPSRDELLEKTVREWPAIGFRDIVTAGQTPARWSEPDYAAFWERANALRLCVALNLNPAQAAALPPLVERFSKITWLLDHMGRPRYDIEDTAFEPVLSLSEFANVYVKISGFYAFTEFSPDYPYQDLARFVKKLLYRFGSSRLLWGE
ncbi:MAG: amidohydrolase family protein [Verrucomicrobiota bacterium]